MLHAALSYVRRHHLALIAIFIALGGTGAYAASRSSGGQIRGFAATPTAGGSGALATLGSVSLRWTSLKHPDERVCTLSLHAARPGDLAEFIGIAKTAAPKDYSVVSKQLGTRETTALVRAQFLPGAPDISEHVEGQLTYADRSHTGAETAIFHVAALKSRCLFEGTLTGSG